MTALQRPLRLVGILAVLLVLAAPLGGHETRSAYLEITEDGEGFLNIVWRCPKRGDDAVPLALRFPKAWRQISPTRQHVLEDAVVESWIVDRGEQGIGGQRVAIEGLARNRTDVLVRVRLADGTRLVRVLGPNRPSFVVGTSASAFEVGREYTVLGIEHILFGIDHLLFVLGLVLIVRGGWLVVKTITSFTIAHSITLALATLGYTAVPGPPVEAVIALSILLLAREICMKERGRASITVRSPWVVAFVFGLLHGFGFAGALADIGLPQGDIPLALLCFNIGVEVGQLLFVAAVCTLAWGLSRLRFRWPAWSRPLPAYGIGCVTAFWFLERVSSFW